MQILLLNILAIAGLGADAQPAKAQIRFAESARVCAARFTLGEIAAVEAADNASVEKIKKLEIGYSPAPGYERKLLRESIRELLLANGMDRESFILSGPPAIVITTKSMSLSPAELLKKAEEFLKSQLNDRGVKDFQLSINGTPLSVQVPAGRDGVRVEAAWRGESKLRGQVGVDLRVFVDGDVHSVVPLVYQIKSFSPALVASRNIAPGEVIGAQNASLQKVEWPDGPQNPLILLQQGEGKASTRTIRTGELVYESDLRLVPLVLKDQAVLVSSRIGALTVSMRGVAQSDGFMGSTITVLNPQGQGPVLGRVVGLGQVEVTLGARE